MKEDPSDLLDQLKTTIYEFLQESGSDYPYHQITLETSLHRHLGIDSIAKAELFHRIEKQFKTRLPDNLMTEGDTLSDILKEITDHPKTELETHVLKLHSTKKSIIDPTKAKTMTDLLFLYAHDDPNRPHIFLQNEQGEEQTITYGNLLENSLRVASTLLEMGLKPSETVAIMQPTHSDFFYSFFGTLLINCIPVPIYPPFRAHQIESYAKQEAQILRNAEVRALITFQRAEKVSKLLQAFIPSLKIVTTVDDLLQTKKKANYRGSRADDPAMIQYTSGSTNAPKGVLLTHSNLLANIRAYGKAIQLTFQDVAVSWAPLYHDLGLIGMWFGSLYHGIPLVLMSPLTFLNRPERWLWAIHSHKGTISGGPNFAYELCIRKIEPDMIEGLDLSSWRIAFNGAEAIQPKTLERFTEKFGPYGFKHNVHLPVYGLAESSVCVAISPLNREPRIDVIDRHALEVDKKAVPTKDTKASLSIVACGIPIPGHEVRVVNGQGQVLPERSIGQFQFKGPSSMKGYYNNPSATEAIHHDSWWDTGDLGYLAENELFITGRKKDLIIKGGRNLYPAEIEELVGQTPEIRKGCVIAFGTYDSKRGTEKLIVVAETKIKKVPNTLAIISQIQEKISTTLAITADEIVLVPPQTVPKTSSGKLQRNACKQAYLANNLKRFRKPLWLQMSKMVMRFSLTKLRNQMSLLGRCIYTLYLYVLLFVTLVPIYLLLWILPRSIISKICKMWSRIIFFLAFCPVKIEGKTHLDPKTKFIYAANHASYIDGILLLGVLPAGTLFIGKHELAETPFIKHFMHKLNFITVNREDFPKGLEDTKTIEETLRTGHSVAIFPEGTFSYAAGLRPFKLGAFKIAVETQSSICPITLIGTRNILRGEEKLFKPGFIRVIVNPPIAPQGNTWQDITDLKGKVRAIIANECREQSLDLSTTNFSE